MGILGYPNMDDDNRDGIFGDYTEVYSNYPESGNNEQNTTESTNLNDNQQVTEQADDSAIPSVAPHNEREANNRLLGYIVILGLLLVAALGMYLYKKGSFTTNTPEQSMGDYFYNQATNSSNLEDVQQTTIEVDLTETVGPEPKTVVSNKNEIKQTEKAEKKQAKTIADKAETKPLNAFEKAELKKKNDLAKEKQISLSATSVTIPVTSGGRVNPFLPTNVIATQVETSKFELIAPPTSIPEVDPLVDDLLQMKISGIMYDSTRPSAIVNIGGTDQLVHKGDLVSGYKINDITTKSVVVQYKSNIYQATVGQTLNDGVNVNPVSNLSNSFGGAYSKKANDTIEINN